MLSPTLNSYISYLCLFLSLSNLSYIKSQLDYSEPKSQWKTPCGDGKRQSPIDFPLNYTNYDNQPFVKFISVNYGFNSTGTINGTFEIKDKNIYKITPNGTEWGYVIFQKDSIDYKYDLKEINFHISSEHKFNGLAGDIEMQLIHVKNNDWLISKNISSSDIENPNLAIGVLIKVASLKDNENFANLNIKTKGPIANYNIQAFPPFGKPFLFYLGSSTTPNCEENTNWVIVHTMEKISKDQYDGFRSWLDTSYPGVMNNRKTQKINDRKLYYQFYPEQVVRPIK